MYNDSPIEAKRSSRPESLPRGVEEAEGGGFSAGIMVAGKYRNLGTFPTPEEAKQCYDRASAKYNKKR